MSSKSTLTKRKSIVDGLQNSTTGISFGQDMNENAASNLEEKETDIPINTIKPRILRKDLKMQFGSKAPEKLQRLLFMLRENEDVFNVFVNNLQEFIYEGD